MLLPYQTSTRGVSVRAGRGGLGGAVPSSAPRSPLPVFDDLLPAQTDSADETVALGRRMGERLEPGDVVALQGDLGAGKTHLAKGIAAGLGLDPAAVASPTFLIVQEHGDGALLHLDLYRIESDAELDRLGLGEMLDGDAVALVEWPERGGAWLPPRTVWLRLTHLGGDRRRVSVGDGKGELGNRRAERREKE